jgi:hypothetical protein
MKHSQTLLVAGLAAALPALVAFSPTDLLPRVEKLSFAPGEGSSLTKTFKNTMSFGLDDMSMLMNGEENPMMPEIEMDMEVVASTTVTDDYVTMGPGRPAVLKRTYDEIGSEMNMEMVVEAMGQSQEESPSGAGTSELEGETVIFTWSDEDDEFKVSFPDDEGGDDDLLENLIEDMDLRVLLPDGEVAEGDSWDIPLAGMVDVLSPGGDLKLDVDMDGAGAGLGGPPPEMMSNMREMFGDMLEGSATATFSSTREVDGVTVAVVDIEIEIDTARDMSEFLEGVMGDEMPEGMDFSLDRVDLEFALEAKGELLWNISAGHIYSLNLEGDAAIAMDMEMGMDFGGQSMSMEMSMEMSGTMQTSVTVD